MYIFPTFAKFGNIGREGDFKKVVNRVMLKVVMYTRRVVIVTYAPSGGNTNFIGKKARHRYKIKSKESQNEYVLIVSYLRGGAARLLAPPTILLADVAPFLTLEARSLVFVGPCIVLNIASRSNGLPGFTVS